MNLYFNRGLQGNSKQVTKFSSIFRNNLFHGDESISGTGSSRQVTSNLVKELPKLLSDLKIYSLLDVPCADFNWMKEIDFSNQSYFGSDIVPELINKLNLNYGTINKKFTEINLINEVPPKVDLIFCRDLLVHLNTKQIRAVISNIKLSESRYLLTTNFGEKRIYKDLPIISRAVGWRPICLTNEPFNFPTPIRIIDELYYEDSGAFSDKSLGLWKIDDLP